MSKLTAAVIFGGRSSEHIVFRMSTTNVIEHINRTRYNVLLVDITGEEHWVKADSLNDVKTGAWRGGTVTALLSSDATRKCMILMDGDKIEEMKLDIVLLILHELYNEDGIIQGLLELVRIPYVGYGVLASAVSMDKLYIKVIASDLRIRQAEYEAVYREELSAMDQMTERIEKHFPYPVFIKPSNAGSFRGINRASNRQELMNGLTKATHCDRKTLVGKAIVRREIECAAFGGGTSAVEASSVGGILAAAEFYDFDAKYFNEDSRAMTDPELPSGAARRVRRTATNIFRTMGGYGLAHVDFLIKDDGGVIFNEINTIPGFTVISMYPMLWETRGISGDQLVEKLLFHDMKRYA